MNINYNDFNKINTSDIYLCKPNQRRITCLNGIQIDTFQVQEHLRDLNTISFVVDKFISTNNEVIVSNGYDDLDYLMEIDIENLGRFIITESPTRNNEDGLNETKTVNCSSLEWKLQGIDLANFKINTGEDISYERLIEDNIDALGRTITYITVYNPNTPELSLLHIICDNYAKGWAVGYVDPIIANKTPYFNIDNTNIYAFLMQDLAKYLQCIITFDTVNKTINLSSVDDIGLNTGVYISFTNLAQSISISPQSSDVYTRYTVRGDNDLDIIQANFGSEQIEDISYYLDTKYMSESLISKYNSWNTYKENKRIDYVNTMKAYVTLKEERVELINKVPLDSLNYNWDAFNEDDLQKELEYFKGLVDCIEDEFRNPNTGKVNMDELKESIYWQDYECYMVYIIPNIQIAIDNYDKTVDKKDDYIDSWKTNWDLYGTDELKVQMSIYLEQMTVLKDYIKAWKDLTIEDKVKYVNESSYLSCHDEYIQAENNYNSAENKYNELMIVVNNYDNQFSNLSTTLSTIVNDVNISNPNFNFTDEELLIIQNFYVDTDYTNSNFTINTYSTASDKIDAELELLNYAKEDLAKQSKPQYNFTTNIDNLYGLEEFKDWHNEVELGNYIWLEINENEIEKLRLLSKTYNPLDWQNNNLTVTFTSNIKWNGKQNDLTALFTDNSGSSSKNSISRGMSTSSSSSDSAVLSNDLIRYIANSRQLSDKLNSLNVQNLVSNEAQFKTALIEYAKINQLDVEVANFIEAHADELFAEYAKISELVATNIKVNTIEGKTANFETILSGAVGAGVVQTICLTADNTTLDNTFINNLLANYITAKAIFGNRISTNNFTIDSDNGKFSIKDNTLTIKDHNNITRIQLGEDATSNFSFLLFDSTGKGILIDSNGITEAAIADGLIKSDKLASKSENYAGISGDKLNIDSMITNINENGSTSISATKVYFDEEKQSLNTIMQQITSKVSSSVEELHTNYYTKKETSEQIVTQIGEATITKNNGQVIKITDALNSVIDTSNEHSQTISKVETTLDGTITNIKVMYTLGTSNTTAPTTGWSTTAPTWVDGKYMWQKTTTIYADGTISESNPTCISGAKGADGKDGSTGATGKGVSAIVDQYYLSTSSTTQAGGSWSTTMPIWVSGYYIWTRSYITWSDSTTSTTTPVLANAINAMSSSIKQNADNIELKVSNNGVISAINQTAESVKISAGKIDLSGYVTISNLSTSGKTTINGGNITTGVIQSSNYVAGTTGIKLDLSNGTIDSKNFKLSSTGEVTATSGSFTGSITATSGTIAGWSINSSAIYKTSSTWGNSSGMYFGTNGLSIKDKFKVDNNGAATASNLTITGGLIQSTNYVASTAGSMLNLNTGAFEFAGGKLKYDGSTLVINGEVTATSGSFTGSVTATSGTIAGWSINSSALYKTSPTWGNSSGMYFGTNGLSIKNSFKVDSSGNFEFADGKLKYSGGILTILGDIKTTGSLYINNTETSSWQVLDTLFETGNNMLLFKDYKGSNILWYSQKDNAWGGDSWTFNLPISAAKGAAFGYANSNYKLSASNFICSGVAQIDGITTFGSEIKVNGNKLHSKDGNGNMGILCKALNVVNYNWTAYMPVYGLSFTNPSSRLVKKNISDMSDEEAHKILDLEIVKYDYKNAFGGNKNQYGLIAEDVLDKIPYCVTVPEGYEESDFDISKGIQNKILGIDYSKLVPYIIKELQLIRKELQSKV